MRSSIQAAVIVALLPLLFLAGCGSSGDPTNSRRSASIAEHQEGFGEESLEQFGSEAAGVSRTTLVGTFRGYMKALAEGNARTACADLAARVQESIAELSSDSEATCEAVMPRVAAQSARSAARRQAAAPVTKVRVDGRRAIVLFNAPGAKLWGMAMVREGGAWKAAAATALVLVPNLPDRR